MSASLNASLGYSQAEPKGWNLRSPVIPDGTRVETIQAGQRKARAESAIMCNQRTGPADSWDGASKRRNRRASIHLSPLASVLSTALLTGSITSIPPVAPHVNPPIPPLKIPRSAWHTVVHRAAQGESLRSIARSLDTSYEAVQRVLLAARQELLGEQQGPPPVDDEDIG